MIEDEGFRHPAPGCHQRPVVESRRGLQRVSSPPFELVRRPSRAVAAPLRPPAVGVGAGAGAGARRGGAAPRASWEERPDDMLVGSGFRRLAATRYACAVNVVEWALVGGFVGALVVSVVSALVAWREGRHGAAEGRSQRAHDLEVRTLEHEHQLQRTALEDAARLRDARVARLTEDARELARALFDLDRLALLMQWGDSADKAEMKRLELSARTRFESARAGLTLDPDGARLTAMFESLTVEIAKYQSMLQSHRVLVEARAVEQVIDHAAQMEVQNKKVAEGVTAAVGEAAENRAPETPSVETAAFGVPPVPETGLSVSGS